MTKWFKLAEQFVDYKFVEYRDFKEYSDGELIKLSLNKLSDLNSSITQAGYLNHIYINNLSQIMLFLRELENKYCEGYTNSQSFKYTLPELQR